MVWDAVWLPWGAPHSITSAPSLEARFPGQWFQLEAGLHYNWHRHYDTSLGRYTQPDPLGFIDGPSVYAYAGGNSVAYVDKDGRWINLVIGGVIGAGIDVALQLFENGGDWRCIGVRQALASGALGALGGGLGGTLSKLRQIRDLYQSELAAARTLGLDAHAAWSTRRALGAELKAQMPWPLRQLTYWRNSRRYGDRLGPGWNPDKMSNVTKTLTDTNPTADLLLRLPQRGLTAGGGVTGGALGWASGTSSGTCGCQR